MPGDAGDPYWNASCTGCTDSLANNYDPASIIDDGSCIYTVYGCTDPTACNYDPLATVDDGSCISTTPVSHTINAGSFYYSPASFDINIGDTVVWVNDGGYHDVNGDINSLTGLSYNNPVSFSLPPTIGPSIIGSYVFTVAGTYNYDCSIGSHAANGMIGSIVVNQVVGCIDSTATNYDPFVVCDDGSCIYATSGCTDSTATNYDPTATIDDGSCNYITASSGLMITEITDPQNSSSTGRYVEIYNSSNQDIDLSTGYALVRWTNASTTSQTPVNLTGIVPAGGFYVVCNSATKFTSTYGIAPSQDIGTGGPADSNGDDNIALLAADGSIIDMFGVAGDGTGTGHEFEDGRAERACGTQPTDNWSASDWNIDNDSGGGDGPQYAPQDFDPFAWACITS